MADTSHLPATKAQYKALEKRGLTGLSNLTRGEVKHIHDRAKEIYYYIRGVWYEIRDSRQQNLEEELYQSLSYEIAVDSMFAAAIIELKQADDRATDDAYRKAVSQGEDEYTWWDYRVAPVKNEWFKLVENILRDRTKKTAP